MNNASQNIPPMDMPPMDMPQDTGNDMGGNFMPQDMSGGVDMQQMPMGDQGQSQFDTNFDAGVDADEEQDPKKYIQQLTGKLSQTLRKYNEDNGQPDVDLNKYVAGMIVKQSMEGLSEDDAEDIINKVKADEDFTMGDDMQQMPQDDGQMMNDPNQQQMPQDNQMQQPQMNENYYKRKNRSQIEEIVNGVIKNMGNNEKPHNSNKTNMQKKSFLKKPFSSPF